MTSTTVLGTRRASRPDEPLHLNIGCGPDGPVTWVNVDRSPRVLLDRCPPLKRVLHRAGVLADSQMNTWPRNIIYADVRRRLPFPDGSAVAIYSSHMLEHLYFDEASSALREFRRLLSPTGVVRLAMPDAERLASDFLAALKDDGFHATLDFNLALSAHPLTRPTGRRRLASKLGASVHRWQPTRQLLTQMLADAGFDSVVERDFLRGELSNLGDVEHRSESFFLEATASVPRRT